MTRATTGVRSIAIVPFRPEHGDAFYALNRAWLDAFGLYEEPDEVHLRDPHGSIIAPGGAVFVALDGSDVIGTAAIAPHGDGEMELIKLTVAEPARGTGLARRLVDTCIAFARHANVPRVVLVSNSNLVAAVKLYEKMGFVHRPMPASNPYATADVYMEFTLEPA